VILFPGVLEGWDGLQGLQNLNYIIAIATTVPKCGGPISFMILTALNEFSDILPNISK